MEWMAKPDTAHSATSLWYEAPASSRDGNNSDIALTAFCPAPLETMYEGWKKCDFLPHFMRATVGSCGDDAQGWRLRLRDEEVPWAAVTIEETPQKRIAWWSKGSRTYRNRGSVCFDSVGRKTTKVSVAIEFYESYTSAVNEGTLRSLKSALDHRLDLLLLHLMPCSALGPSSASL
jgi:uncharacterized membrane protein